MMTRAIQAPRSTSLLGKFVPEAEKNRALLDTARYVLIAEKKHVLPQSNPDQSETVADSIEESTAEDAPAPGNELSLSQLRERLNT